jgi:outer membrane lipoprotein-sorting protein
VNILRRLPLSRLLMLCGLVVVLGGSLTALALALGSGPTPPPKPLAQAVHDALTAAPVQGVSANVKLTDNLLEGASLAGGGSSGEAGPLSQSPLLSGASGRLWASDDGRVRLELQAEKGDTQALYDGHTLTVYDASTNTLYRFTLPDTKGADGQHEASQGGEGPTAGHGQHQAPSVAEIEEAIGKLKHVDVSGATPANVAGQPAYTARVTPEEGGSLIGGAELSWDAENGLPLRAAVYSSSSSSPVIELAASEVSFGPVASSVFEFTPPSNAKVEEIALGADARHGAEGGGSSTAEGHPTASTRGSGITAVHVLEAKVKPGEKQPNLREGLQKVKLDQTTTASELPTALGTVLSFERSGVRFLLAGAVAPSQIEAVARGL